MLNDRLTWYDTGKGWRTESLENFGNKWSGAVLLAEADENSGESNYLQNRAKERLQLARQIILFGGGLLLLAFGLLHVSAYATPTVWGLVLTKLLGTVASLLLLTSQFDRQNPLVARLCQVSSKTNCQTVLDSSVAKLWGWLSWAEIGSFYFAGGLLTLLLTNHPAAALSMLTALSALALPYTVFSFYYQWKVAKNWCVLCLVVQGLLAVEFIITLTQWPLTFPATLALVLPEWLVGFGLPVLGYAFIKPWLTSRYKLQAVQAQLRRFKNDPALFQTLLQQQPTFTTPPPASSLILGNPAAPHTITMVTNLYCGPCAKAHEELEQLVRQNGNLKAQIVFLAYDGPKGQIYTASRHLLALNEKKPMRAVEALSKWYGLSQKEYTNWAIEFPAAGELSQFEVVVNEHYHWCQHTGVDATPTIFLNGYQLPERYRLRDLVWVQASESTTIAVSEESKQVTFFT